MFEKSILKHYSAQLSHQKCLKHAMDVIGRILELKQKRRQYQLSLNRSEQKNLDAFKRNQGAQMIYNISMKLLYTNDKTQRKSIIEELRITIIKDANRRIFK